MIDIRGELTRSKTIPQTLRNKTVNITIHYNGPSVAGFKNDIDLIKSDAKFHTNIRGWDGLSYHYAIGRNGEIYWCRDYMARLAHCGVAQGNSESLAVLVITGEGDTPPQVQLNSLENFITELKISPRYVLGHQEWPRATSCPGAKLLRWLNDYRYRHANSFDVHLHTKLEANVRDEASVLSHLVRVLPNNAEVLGNWVLGKPVKGDSLWLHLSNTSDYIHASLVNSESYQWNKNF